MQWLGHSCMHNQNLETGTSLVVQWVRFLVRESRFHMLCDKAKNMFIYNIKIIFLMYSF